ncbi:hypothetical protein EYF80_011860 [Liparis tanakae]|uniref:Uncharacterized protein n=1 Tax=Liparis tanakae TaxID=230148 RepID=A0A4Z2IJG6_9TELE|nr:hypothetical protein EYF80_011860 [Liparis tanakae]
MLCWLKEDEMSVQELLQRVQCVITHIVLVIHQQGAHSFLFEPHSGSQDNVATRDPDHGSLPHFDQWLLVPFPNLQWMHCALSTAECFERSRSLAEAIQQTLPAVVLFPLHGQR